MLLVAACGHVNFDELHDAAPDGVDTPVLAVCEAHADALLCEDFESGVDRWPTQVGTTNVVMSPVYDGTLALAGSIQGYPDAAYIGIAIPALTPQTSLHVRAWLFVPTGFTAEHINLINVEGPNFEGVSIYLTLGSLAVYRNTPQQGSVAGPAVARDGWSCVELALGIADTDGTIELRVADQIVATGTGLDTKPTGGFSTLKVGVPFSGTAQSGPATVYVDDIVVDVTPIGCAP